MKKLFLSTFIVVGMTMMISSCQKDHVDPPPTSGGGGTTTAPVFTKVVSDTPWFNQPAHIDVQATGASGFYIGSDQISVPYTTPTGLTSATTYHIVAKSSDGKAASTDFTPPFWSQKMTSLCNKGRLRTISMFVCREDSINFPSAWHDKSGLINPSNLTQLFTDGSSQMNGGPRSLPGVWSLQSNETVYFDGLQHWIVYDPNAPTGHIPYLNDSGWKGYKVEPDQVNPSILMRTEIVCSH